ncbi:MAG: ribonuclease III [Candidatus Hydrogenedentes bacterium]|nr:ribonuclease III [Candidatus Hydrogenedentota bacterium]
MDDRDARNEALRVLASRLGIDVNDFALFDRALTHASLVAESAEATSDYEALEFLGDAVLGLAVAHRLFELTPERTPGDYSRLRAGLVSRVCVARVAQALELAPAIRLGKGEESSGGRERTALLADCLEALIGAIYLDSGWEAARTFVVRMFEDEIAQSLRQDRVWDYKSRLQNYCQAQHMALPQFEVVRSEGPDHCKEFEVEVVVRGRPAGRGRGATKKEAEQQAARAALEQEGCRFD